MKFEDLKARLPIAGLGKPIHCFDTVGSTNDVAAGLAERGAGHGTLVVADEQTQGRGRGGTRWLTPGRAALAMSLVLRPQTMAPQAAGRLTALGALGVVEALDELGARAEIKWPNDVLLEGRKVGGILAETTWSGQDMDYTILGIGLNIRPGSVPPSELVDYPATCVDVVLGQRTDRARLLLGILGRVGSWWSRISEEEFLAGWENRLAFLGKPVEAVSPEGVIRGFLVGLSPEGALRLRTAASGDLELFAGVVHLRPVDMWGD